MTWQTTNTAKGDNKLYSDARGVVPSLDLRFASQKNLNDYMTGTPLVNHQRSMSGSNLSPGTFVNSSGLIETAKVNLVTYSDYSVVETTTDAQLEGLATAPDGTLTARRYSVPSTGLDTINKLATVIDGGTHTFSVWIRSTGSTSQVRTITGNPQFINVVDITTNWQRFSFTKVNNSGTGSRAYVQMLNVGDEIEVWGAQVEEGSTATTYIPTTNVLSAAPRFDHNPTTGESLGLLIEESRTNLFDYSTDLTQWTGSNSAAPVASSEIAPDGSTDAYKLNINIGGTSYFYRNVPTVAGNVYTISVWAKNLPGEQNFFDLFFNTAGSVQLGKTALTDTWTRYHITGTATQTGNALAGINNPPDDYTARGLFWGFQFELGAFPTSYIPTDGAALTRNPDNATITGSDFSSWFNSPEGTLFTDLQTPNTSCFGWNVSDGSNNNRFVFDPGVNTGTAAAIVSGGGPTFGTPPTVLAGGGKIAFAYKPNDYGVYGNQTQLAGTSPAAVPTGLNQIGLGYRGNYAPDAYLNGTIARLTYFPDRLEDSVLQAITQ